MDINHPWTKYEIARLRDEERLLRARSAMRAIEARDSKEVGQHLDSIERSESLVDRLKRLGLAAKRAPVRSGA